MNKQISSQEDDKENQEPNAILNDQQNQGPMIYEEKMKTPAQQAISKFILGNSR